MSEPRPCPFCGGTSISVGRDSDSQTSFVECNACAADTVELWNHRPLESAAESRGKREGFREGVEAAAQRVVELIYSPAKHTAVDIAHKLRSLTPSAVEAKESD